MHQPEHLLRAQQTAYTPRRAVSLGLVAAFHVAVILAFASGLANRFVEKLPEDIIAKVEPPKLPDVKPPPPPPPKLEQPPPPFVPPPDIVIESPAAPNTGIHTQSQVANPPPKPAGITAPASIGAAHNCDKYYPPIAQRLNQEGTVLLEFHLSADGTVSDPKVVESSGHDSLDQAALRCVPGWHYKPALQNGAPVETTWKAQVRFRMQGG